MAGMEAHSEVQATCSWQDPWCRMTRFLATTPKMWQCHQTEARQGSVSYCLTFSCCSCPNQRSETYSFHAFVQFFYVKARFKRKPGFKHCDSSSGRFPHGAQHGTRSIEATERQDRTTARFVHERFERPNAPVEALAQLDSSTGEARGLVSFILLGWPNLSIASG